PNGHTVWEVLLPKRAFAARPCFPLLSFGLEKPRPAGIDLESLAVQVEHLKMGDTRRRYRGLKALFGRLDEARTVSPAVAKMLDDDPQHVRGLAMEILGKIGAPALPQLIEGLDSTNARKRGDCAQVIGNLGPAGAPAVQALAQRLKDTDAEVRQR